MTKADFPWIYVPVAAASVFLIDTVISLLLYGLILAYYGIMPSWTIVLLPALILLTLIATLSIGVLLSALTVFYRDFRHIVPFLTQILMFVTPVIYPATSSRGRTIGSCRSTRCSASSPHTGRPSSASLGISNA